MPVAPGRSVAILVEVAARNQLLRSRGHHAARELADQARSDACATSGCRARDEEDEELEPGGSR